MSVRGAIGSYDEAVKAWSMAYIEEDMKGWLWWKSMWCSWWVFE